MSRDPLEETQDMDIDEEFPGGGVWRIMRGAGVSVERAPELSVRYPSIAINLTKRQAE